MDYITVKEAATRWNIAIRSVQNYCTNDKIPGVKRIGGQWFIPIDAKPPLDGRTIAAKNQQKENIYRFPVFVYSRYYKNQEELSEDEQCLLRTQLFHFEGKHKQSLILCQSLLKKELPLYLKAGVYLTAGIDSFLLGLTTKYEEMVALIENLTTTETKHKEDFLLMTYALKFYIDWDPSNILKIQPSRLSSDAIWYYQTLILTVAALSSSEMPIYFFKFWESCFPLFEKEGMTPMIYFLFCGLGVLNNHNRTTEEKEDFLKKGVKIAIEHNWTHNLSRYYNFSPESLDKIVKSFGDVYYNELMKSHKETINNWNILHSKKTGFSFKDSFTPKQFEILLLIAYGYTYKEISLCLGMNKNDIKQEIKDILEISQTTNQTQLRDYARKLYDSSYKIK